MTINDVSISPQLKILTDARQNCRICMNSHPSAIRNGSEFSFDPYVVSHWSQWLGDLHPKLVVVGQDFGDLSYFERLHGRDDPNNITNKHLFELLVVAGFRPKRPPLLDQQSGVFLTNSILCFKTANGMSNAVAGQGSNACTSNHLLPLLGLLKPQVIVALGGPAWIALRKLFQLSSTPVAIGQAAGQHWSTKNAELFAVGHCSGLGMRNRRKYLQIQDWERIGSFMSSLPQ